MSDFRSSNPTLKENIFQSGDVSLDASEQMSLAGTVNKTAMLTFILLLAASWVWHLFYTNGGGNPATMHQGGQAVIGWMIGGLILGLITAIITTFKPGIAYITAPIYAVGEGFALGGISAFVQSTYPDKPIVIQAVALTLGVLVCMLAAYSMGIIKATERLRTGLLVAGGAICMVYLVSMVLRMFGSDIPYIHSSGPIGIGFSLLVVGIASFYLILDFDFIERAIEQGAPKKMEWYAGFSLLVTLVWIYLEILRLLQKLNSKSRN